MGSIMIEPVVKVRRYSAIILQIIKVLFCKSLPELIFKTYLSYIYVKPRVYKSEDLKYIFLMYVNVFFQITLHTSTIDSRPKMCVCHFRR